MLADLKRRTMFVMSLTLCHFLLMLVLIPPWEGQDEPMHYEYISLISLGYLPAVHILKHDHWWREVPRTVLSSVESSILQSMKTFRFWQINELKQPDDLSSFSSIYHGATALNQAPLYYCLCAAVISLCSIQSVIVGLYACRLVSLCFWLVTVYLTLKMARLVLGQQNPLSLLPPIMIGLLPMPAMNAILVNNDALAVCLSTALILFLTRALMRGGRLFDLFWSGLLIIVALLTKRTTLPLVFLMVVFAGLSFIRTVGIYRLTRFVALAVPCLVCVAIVLMSAYTGPFDSSAQTIPSRQDNFFTYFLNMTHHKLFFHYFSQSFWAAFVWGHHFLNSIEYYSIYGTMVVVLLALMWAGVSINKDAAQLNLQRLKVVLLFVAAIILQFSLIYTRFFWQVPVWNIAQGRFLFVMLAPITILMTLGFQNLVPRTYRHLGCAILVLVLFLVSLHIQLHYILPHYYMYYY